MEETKKELNENQNIETTNKTELTLEQLLTKFTNLETTVNSLNKQLENTFINKIDLKENPETTQNEPKEDFELG